ncbi:hypothetical protein C8J57DRAFT_1526638 [Mycena rebaudengoi]|nr:hypothetical protein C8J57DRAFT_1526638 [Mycena rebaudengoi]
MTKKKKTSDERPKKRGTPSHFQGKRAAFLEAHVTEFLAHSKKKTVPAFYQTFFPSYWRAFPWRLGLTEEPPDEPEPVPADVDEAFKALDLDLTPEEIERKATIQTETKAKIKNWFGRKRSGNNTLHKNPYFAWLSKMHEVEAPAPKRLADYQYYMQHDDFKNRVTKRFNIESCVEPRSKHITLRCKIAREMLEAEPEDVKKRLKEEADVEHEDALARHQEEDEGMPSVDPAVQEEVRKNFNITIEPLLQGLRAYTGYYINVVAARLDGDKYDVVSANAGTIDGKDWAHWDPKGYNDGMLRNYVRFVHAASGAGPEPPAASQQVPPPISPALQPGVAQAPVPALQPPQPQPQPPALQPGVAQVPAPPPVPASQPPPITTRSRMPVPPDVHWAFEGLQTPLCDELGALPPAERDARLQILKRGGMDLVQENNAARNRLWMTTAGLQSFSIWEGMKQAKNPRKRAAKGDGGKGKKKRKKRDEWSSDSDEDDETDHDDDDDDDGAKGRRGRRGRRGKGRGTRGATAKTTPHAARRGRRKRRGTRGATAKTTLRAASRGGGREKVPPPPILPGANWATINKKYLLNQVGGHLGEEWEMLMERWWDLEKSTNFITSVKSHATKNRPAEVHEWVKAAHRGSPEINDVEAFGKQW